MNSLNETPRAGRLHISIFGKRNSGKSSLINALTNAYKAGPEIDKILSETDENKQNAKKLIEDTKDILARRTGTEAYSPEAAGQKKAAEEAAVNTKKIEMQAAELNEFIKRPLASKVIPTDVHKAAGLSPDIKTYADAARLYGPKEAMDKLTDAYVRTKTASISAAGVSSAAANQTRTTVIQTLKTIQDGQLKDRDKSMLMVTKLRDKMNTILMNPQEKAANDVELAFWVKQLEGDMARLGKTESQLQSLLSIEPKPAGPEPKSKFKKGTSPGDKGAEKIKLRVNGKTISATRVGDTQARGEDGKLYNIKQK